MITENLTTLKINKLTKAQYEAALAAGTVSENELYMTPEEEAENGGVFIATYDTTTFDEILNAYNSGKTIIAKYNGNIYQLASADTSTSFMFVSVAKNSEYVTYVECEFTGDWYFYNGKRFLPDAGTANNGKVLMVINGAWKATEQPYTYGTADLTAGTSELATGKLYFRYE